MSQATSPPTPVAGRECGECTYCCQYLLIDEPELQSLPGAGCRHCAIGNGCTIYETRPPICHVHFCGWRLSALFDDSWRPDRIGMMMTVVNHNIPPQYMQEGLELLVIEPAITFARNDFYQFIMKAVARKVPVFIALPGPVGFANASVLANPLLEKPVEEQNEKDFMGLFEAMVKILSKGPFNPIVLKHGESKTGP